MLDYLADPYVIASIIQAPFTIYGSIKIAKQFRRRKNKEKKGNIAILPLEGIIKEGEIDSFSKGITPYNVNYCIEKSKRCNPKGYILSINSPGGSASACKKITKILERIKEPKIALVNGVAASGGYLLAISSDYIIAEEFDIIGSIGVINPYVNPKKLLDKLGIEFEFQTAGKHKDHGLIMVRDPTDEEKEMNYKKLEHIYDWFVREVIKGRKLKGCIKEQAAKIAEGKIFLGYEAKELGLIDKIGSLDEAVKKVEELGDFKKAKLLTYKPLKNFIGSLFKMSIKQVGRDFGQGIYESLTERIEQQNNELRL